MSQENVEIVRQMNAALNSGDLDRALSCFADNAEVCDLRSAPDQPLTVTGRDAMRRVLAGWIAAFDALRADVDEWIDAGPAVIASAHWWGTGRESGVSIDARQYDLYSVEDGKVVRAVLGYGSKQEALEAAERSE
jgi:ketosteroid isomerase-like protein